MHEGKHKTIAFASRTLTVTERNYSVIEREALAAAWAFEYFRVYVWGRKIVLKTDHKPLLKVLVPGGDHKVTARLARLASSLQEYQYEVQYIPGWQNCQADCLSRLPLPWDSVDKDSVLSRENEGPVATVFDLCNVSLGSIDEAEWLRVNE